MPLRSYKNSRSKKHSRAAMARRRSQRATIRALSRRVGGTECTEITRYVKDNKHYTQVSVNELPNFLQFCTITITDFTRRSLSDDMITDGWSRPLNNMVR